MKNDDDDDDDDVHVDDDGEGDDDDDDDDGDKDDGDDDDDDGDDDDDDGDDDDDDDDDKHQARERTAQAMPIDALLDSLSQRREFCYQDSWKILMAVVLVARLRGASPGADRLPVVLVTRFPASPRVRLTQRPELNYHGASRGKKSGR